MTTPEVAIPHDVRVRLTHGYLQLLANQHGVDLLHVKGPAVHPVLASRGLEGDLGGRASVDADVLVRPRHVERFLQALHGHGWSRLSGFEEGSAFAHAMNLRHAQLGLTDVHRSWPGFGIDGDAAFDLLWADREHAEIAAVSCAVPALPAQRLILLLHAARSGGIRTADTDASWTNAEPAERDQVRGLAADFHAELALAAATGHLEDYRQHPEYQLWRHFSQGSQGRWDEWGGRWRAARGPVAKARVVRGFVRVNPDLLRDSLGHEPSRKDYVIAYADRLRAAAADLARIARRGRGGS